MNLWVADGQKCLYVHVSRLAAIREFEHAIQNNTVWHLQKKLQVGFGNDEDRYILDEAFKMPPVCEEDS